jgi:predicted ferric reductase
LAIAVDTTNSRDGVLVMIYCPEDDKNTIFAKELNEFNDKFESTSTIIEYIKSTANGLWDGITDVLTEDQITRIEKLYSKELKVLGIL